MRAGVLLSCRGRVMLERKDKTRKARQEKKIDTRRVRTRLGVRWEGEREKTAQVSGQVD